MSNSSSGELCSICNKTGHKPETCSKVKGCGACGVRTTHKVWTKDCKAEKYPRYDAQICDVCYSPDHEAIDCSGRIRDVCDLCGHEDHRLNKNKKEKCRLVKGLDESRLPDYAIDQFTEKYRKNYLDQRATTLAQPAAIALSHDTPLKSSAPFATTTSLIGLTATVQATGPPPTDKETMSARRNRWQEAEIKCAHKPALRQDPRSSVEVESNFFEIQIDTKVMLWRYSITVQEQSVTASNAEGEQHPEASAATKRRIKRETKASLIREYLTNATVGNVPVHTKWASDYESMIVSVGHLYDTSDPHVVGKTMLSSSLRSRPPQHGRIPPPPLVVSVSEVGILDMDRLIKHVEKKTLVSNLDVELKALNLICWKEINENAEKMGGRVGNKVYPSEIKFNKAGANDGSAQYLIRHGFFSSMRPGDGSIILNVNAVTSAFLPAMNLQKWMDICWGARTPSEKEFKLKLKDVRVTLNLHNPSRTWVIAEISDKKVGETKFKKDQILITVSKHLKQTYSQYRPNENAYCINVGGVSNKVWFPADQLTIVAWQVVRETMDGRYSEQMLTNSVKKPIANKEYIMKEGLEILGLNPLQPFYKDFGLSLKKTPASMVRFNAFQLMAPKIILKAGDKDVSGRPTIDNGGWNLSKQKRFFTTGTIKVAPAVINFGSPSEPRYELPNTAARVRISLEALAKAFKTYSMATDNLTLNVINAKQPDLGWDKRSKFRESCQEVFNKAAEKFEKGYQFLLVILPSKDIRFYCEVKRWTDCILGMPSVCITEGNLVRLSVDPMLEANLCIKINFKLGGTSHNIEPNGTAFHRKLFAGAREDTMIVGADVTHPQKKLQDCPSIAAVVAQHKPNSSHFYGAVRLQQGRQEYIADLSSMMREHVLGWFNQNSTKSGPSRLPKNILFYRDGVSESQFGMIACEEKHQIEHGCQEAFKELRKKSANNMGTKPWNPPLTLLVVTKRHHARFFPVHGPGPKTTPGSREDINAKCGMVADTKVVLPHMWDFYLQSHHSQLGTAKGAHYVVIHDGVGYNSNEIQHITNNLCYTNQRATKVMSVCTPARYADFLCTRMRCYMKPVMDTSYNKTVGVDDKGKAVLEDDGVPKYVAAYENDEKVWLSNNASGRKPWHKNMDRVMFYL